MRKVKVSVASSLDNYIAGTDGGYDWIRMDQDYGFKEFLATVDTVLMGRKMHDFMLTTGIPSYEGCITTSSLERSGVQGKGTSGLSLRRSKNSCTSSAICQARTFGLRAAEN